MLRRLRIQNLAVVDATEVEFGPGFTVLTGETGAGKSIVADAVDLLTGGRASADSIRTGASQAIVEGLFERGGSTTLIRREISASGRGRAFVNGSAVTVGQVRELTSGLVEIHGQHEQQRLLDPELHLSILDAFADVGDALGRVGDRWAELSRLRAAHQRASMDARERGARLEWLGFQLAELESVQPKAGEDEVLMAEKQRLQHAERVQRLCREGHDLLAGRDGAVSELLGGVWKRVDELAQIDRAFEPFADGRGGVSDFFDDLARAFESSGESLEDAEARLTRVEDRLARIERLRRQHGPSLAEVLERWSALRGERDDLLGAAEPDTLLAQVQLADAEYLRAARVLSTRRQAASAKFSRALESALAGLAMEHTRFEVRFAEAGRDTWGERGLDRAEFFVSANVGEEPRPLARVASGGELSRVMLALHLVALAGRDQAGGVGPATLVFDEVDAGIGGRVAESVGECLAALGRDYQVLCVTHLAGIAARASSHVAIEKRSVAGRTVTRARVVAGDDRVAEVARMLAGTRASAAARDAARELMSGADASQGESRTEGKGRKRKSQERP